MSQEAHLPDTAAPVAQVGGRELTPAVPLLAGAVGVVSLLTGALLALVSLTGHVFGAWRSPEPLSPGLVGAAMLGVSPGLFVIGRARVWEEVRTLVLPLVIVLLGMLAVSVVNGDSLQAAKGGSVFLVLFSLGWVAVLGVLGLAAVVSLLAQFRKPVTPLGPRIAPLPAWSKPLLAVLGSGWFGIGAGLLVRPGFWGALVPWNVDRADAQGLGVWGLALGVGILGALAEDDLSRIRPALLAVPGVAIAAGAVLALHASAVSWSSGGALSLVSLLGGLLVTGVLGRLLWSRGPNSRA